MDLKAVIRTIPNFPEQGVLFRDITPILQNPDALCYAVDQITGRLMDYDFDLVIGPESRGFIFGVPAAFNMKKGFVPVRKAGKLPAATIRKEYALEYGTAVIEMHKDAVQPGQKVVVVDDLLATGGTCRALTDMVEEAGGQVVAMIFLIELEGLNGREVLKDYAVESILTY